MMPQKLKLQLEARFAELHVERQKAAMDGCHGDRADLADLEAEIDGILHAEAERIRRLTKVETE